MKISVRKYLSAVLPGLNDLSIQRVADLTPRSLAARSRLPRIFHPDTRSELKDLDSVKHAQLTNVVRPRGITGEPSKSSVRRCEPDSQKTLMSPCCLSQETRSYSNSLLIQRPW